MNLAEELKQRGFIQDSSADIEKILAEKRTIYIGTDPTADSLHVGHLAWVMLMKRLSDAGHKVILLVGGGTGMIGDPKEKGERTLKAVDEIDRNAAAFETQLKHLLGDRADFIMVNNAEWLREVKLLDFLRDIGKHFTVNDLIKRDLIRRRLETPDESISYTEFTYALLQAYDYRELNARYGCDVQVGGSDQWTNILSGVDLIRKKEGKEVFAFSIPLTTDAAGRKFGKSEGNAVWLDANKTTPRDFYQFWINVDDEKVVNYLKIYTLLSLEEISEIEKEFNNDKSTRLAQRRLAEEVTRFVHGEANTEKLPEFNVKSGDLIVDVLVACGLAASKREAREFIESGAVTLDDVKVTDVSAPATPGVLQRGKKKMNATLLVSM